MKFPFSLSREAQVGLLFFSVVGLLFTVTVFVGDIQFFQSYFRVAVTFDEAAGLQKGDDVLLSGVRIGKVEEVTFDKYGRIITTLRIRQGNYRIYDNSEIAVSSTSALGGKQVEITMPAAPGIEIRHDGTARLVGKKPKDLQRALESAATSTQTFMDKASQMVEEVKPKISKSMDNIEKFTNNLNEGKGLLPRLVNDEKLAEKTEAAIDSVKNAADPIRKAFGVRTTLFADYRSIPEKDFSVGRLGLRLEPEDGGAGPAPDFYEVGIDALLVSRSSEMNTPRRLTRLQDNENDPFYKPDVQLGWRFMDKQFSFSLGVLEGEIGGRVFVEPKWLQFKDKFVEKIWLRAEGRQGFDNKDLDEGAHPFLLRADLGFDLRPFKDGPLLRIYGGADNLLDKPGWTVGFGIEIEDKNIKTLVGLVGMGR